MLQVKTNNGVEYSNYSTEFIGTRRTQWTWLSHALSTVLYITLNKENPYSSPSYILPLSSLYHKALTANIGGLLAERIDIGITKCGGVSGDHAFKEALQSDLDSYIYIYINIHLYQVYERRKKQAYV